MTAPRREQRTRRDRRARCPARPADPAEPTETRTLRQVSKTERALTSSEADDALEELFDDESFDAAFEDDAEPTDASPDPSGEISVGQSSDDASPELDATEIDDAEVADAELEPIDLDETEVDATDVDETSAELLDSSHDVEHDDPDHDDTRDDEGGSVASSDDESADAEPGVADELDDDDVPTAELRAPITDERVDDAPTPVNEPAIADPQNRADPDVEADDDDVSDRILEELRRADIDGPVVAFAPQDDTTTARRRPKQSADYDPAPVPIPAKVPRVLGRKARVRKVTRVVRHVDPWSVFKIALVAFIVMYVIVLTASVLLWNVAYATGTVDNVERFFESFGWNSFEFNGGELYHAGWIAGLFVVIGLTGLAVLAATLFNLITDLVGGVRFTVLEEEVVETRTSPMRRFVVRRAEPEVPAVIRDSSGAMYREAVVDDGGANARPTR